MIKITNLTKTFKLKGSERLNLLHEVDFQIKKGEYVSIMGTSGVGKSTLLNIIGLIEPFDSGEYFIFNKDTKKLNDGQIAKIRGNNIGYIFQDFLLIDELSVYDNIFVSCIFSKETKNKIKSKILESLEMCGLDRSIINKKVGLLSGGQKQRVAIARAIIKKPDIILADEPTGSIDENTKEGILELFDSLNKQGITIITITHDIDVANRANKIYIIENKKITEKN